MTDSAYGSSTNNNEVDTAGNFERGGVYNSLKKGARKLVGRSKSSASTGSRYDIQRGFSPRNFGHVHSNDCYTV